MSLQRASRSACRQADRSCSAPASASFGEQIRAELLQLADDRRARPAPGPRPDPAARCRRGAAARACAAGASGSGCRAPRPPPRPRSGPECPPSRSCAASPTRDDAEVRIQRRERIVGDLRPRGRNRADQRRFAGVGQAQQADVGDHLELEPSSRALARQARAALARRAVLARLLKRWLPQPPLPPFATSRRLPALRRDRPASRRCRCRARRCRPARQRRDPSPPRPVQSWPPPGSPFCARKVRWTRKSASVLMPSLRDAGRRCRRCRRRRRPGRRRARTSRGGSSRAAAAVAGLHFDALLRRRISWLCRRRITKNPGTGRGFSSPYASWPDLTRRQRRSRRCAARRPSS